MTDLERIEKQLDDANAQYGDERALCLYCHSNEYNGKVGIIHEQDCAIMLLRNMIRNGL